MRYGRGTGRRGEGGLVLFLVAFLVPVMVVVAAIVIDMGQGYVTAREMQNAADAAALAGSRTLDRVKAGKESPSAVAATALSVATANGAEASRVTCTVIGWRGNALGPCSNMVAVTHEEADGVDVTAGRASPTFFLGSTATIGAVTRNLVVSRDSAATIQPLISQDAPLLVCAFGQSDGKNPSPDIFVGSPGSYVINPVAVGRRYLAHGPHVADCGLPGSGWKGVSASGTFTLPDWLGIDTGVRAGPVRSQILGEIACGTTLTVGCALVLPVCSMSNQQSGTNGQLYCDRFAGFRLVTQTSNSHTFELLGRSTVTNGRGGAGRPGPHDVRIVSLIE